jgi:hypothetical protein
MLTVFSSYLCSLKLLSSFLIIFSGDLPSSMLFNGQETLGDFMDIKLTRQLIYETNHIKNKRFVAKKYPK